MPVDITKDPQMIAGEMPLHDSDLWGRDGFDNTQLQ